MGYNLNDLDLSLTNYSLDVLSVQQSTFLDRYYFQTVVSVEDKLHLGRLKFRISHLHRGLEDEDLPWQRPAYGHSNLFGIFNVPQKQSTILIRFLHGNINNPVYYTHDIYKVRSYMNEYELETLEDFNFVPSDQLHIDWEQGEFATETTEYNGKKHIFRIQPQWMHNMDENGEKIIDDLPLQEIEEFDDTYDKIQEKERFNNEKIRLQLKSWGTMHLDDLERKEFRRYSPQDDEQKMLYIHNIDYDQKLLTSNEYRLDIDQVTKINREVEYSGAYLDKTISKEDIKYVKVIGAKSDDVFNNLTKDNLQSGIVDKFNGFSNYGGDPNNTSFSDYNSIFKTIQEPPMFIDTFHVSSVSSENFAKKETILIFDDNYFHKTSSSYTDNKFDESIIIEGKEYNHITDITTTGSLNVEKTLKGNSPFYEIELIEGIPSSSFTMDNKDIRVVSQDNMLYNQKTGTITVKQDSNKIDILAPANEINITAASTVRITGSVIYLN